MNKLAQIALLVVGCSVALFAAPPGFGAAPEIDGGSAVTALALLSGMVLVIRGRAKQ